MFRLFLLIVVFLSLSVPAMAQFEYDPTLRLAKFDNGWCTRGNAVNKCGFMSANAACEYSVNDIYNGQRYVSGGATKTSGTTAKCVLAEVAGRNLFIGAPLAVRDCADGAAAIGGSCMRTRRQLKNQMCSAGTNHFSLPIADPIDLVSGRNRQEIVDFQTADGYLKLSRFYMSSANGGSEELPQLATRTLGQNWNLSSHPQLIFASRSFSLANIKIHTPEGIAYTFFQNTDGTYSMISPRTFGGGTIGISVERINDIFEVRRFDGITYVYSTETVRPDPGPNASLEPHVRFATLKSIRYEGGYEQFYTYNGWVKYQRLQII